MEVKGKTEAGLTVSGKNHSQVKPVFTIILFRVFFVSWPQLSIQDKGNSALT